MMKWPIKEAMLWHMFFMAACNMKGHVACVCVLIYIQGVSRLVDITAGGDFLGLCDQKSSYKHVSDFGWLRSYDRLNLRIESNNY